MAADHRRKRLNGVSIAGCSHWEQNKTKKRKLEPRKNELNSHISLQWDGSKKKVVAKSEQVGLRQKDFREFVDTSSEYHSVLADVVAIPREIFELENLMGVLSLEVWNTCLSESERKYLMKFLPRGSGAEEVVLALLSGNNFHFGNPCLKWGASLCLGNLHPDAVIRQEQHINADKKAYYSEIQNYHNDMIKYLQQLKEIWEAGDDTENEVLRKILRSRRDADKQISSHENDFRSHDHDGNSPATSESCSLVGEEKACSSDDQNSSITKGNELQQGMHDRGFMEEKSRTPLVALDDGESGRVEKRNIQHVDGDKYMSYLKISKKQHQLVKSMKESGKSIQSKSLNRVLGNLHTLQVQPYELFMKEEQKKLQEHWSQLVKKDLPAAYEGWRHQQFQRREISKSLEQDVKDRLESLMEDGDKVTEEQGIQHQDDLGARKHESEDDENGFSEDDIQYQNDQGARQYELYHEDVEKSSHEACFEDQEGQDLRNHEFNAEDEEKESHATGLLEDQIDGVREHESYAYNEDSGSGSPEYQSPQQISSNSGNDDLNPIDMDSEINVASKLDATSPNTSRYSCDANTADASIGQGVPLSSGRDVWPAASSPHTFYDSSMNHEYASSGELSLPHPINETQRPQLMDLENDVNEEDTRKNLLPRQSDDGSFSSYTNQDRTGLLQSLFKGQEPCYHRDQNQTGLEFQVSQNILTEDTQFTGHLPRHVQPSLPLEQGQRRPGENYTQSSMSAGIFSEGGAYLVSRQGHEPPVNLQHWPVNPVGMSARFQSHLSNDALLSQNWYSGEHHHVHGGWNSTNGAGVSGQSIGNNTDQSLYSVLSQYDQSRLSNHSNSIGPTEQFMLPRNFGIASGVGPRINTSLPQASLPLDYISGRDAASSLMSDDMGWMNLPQNPGLHDPLGKSYLRSWNQ